MECLSPIRLPRKIPGDSPFQDVPCGKCLSCLQKKRRDWTIRLLEEEKKSSSSIFITLTYDEKNLPIINDEYIFEKRELQLFLKRLRKKVRCNIDKKSKVSQIKGKGQKIKYFITAEYGEKFKRPHYHAILFNIGKDVDLEKIWGKGIVHVGRCEKASVHYVTKYCINRIAELQGKEKGFCLMSKNIGGNYVKRSGEWHRSGKRFYIPGDNGIKIPLPRYYRDKIFNKGQILVNGKEVEKEKDKKIIESIIKGGHFESEINRKSDFVRRIKNINKKDKL